MGKSKVCSIRKKAFIVFACTQLEKCRELEDSSCLCLRVFPLYYEGRSQVLGIELYVDVGRFHRRKLCERLILSETPGSAGSGGWAREIVGKGNSSKGRSLRLACELVGVPSMLIKNVVVHSKSEREIAANESGIQSSIYDL